MATLARTMPTGTFGHKAERPSVRAEGRSALKSTGSTWRWRKTRKRILDRDGHRCRYCGGVATTVDHVIPRVVGGGDEDWNLVACCGLCQQPNARPAHTSAAMSSAVASGGTGSGAQMHPVFQNGGRNRHAAVASTHTENVRTTSHGTKHPLTTDPEHGSSVVRRDYTRRTDGDR